MRQIGLKFLCHQNLRNWISLQSTLYSPKQLVCVLLQGKKKRKKKQGGQNNQIQSDNSRWQHPKNATVNGIRTSV